MVTIKPAKNIFAYHLSLYLCIIDQVLFYYNMLTLKKTNSHSEDFRTLVTLLDKELRERDGEEHSFYAQFNKVDAIKHVILAYNDKVPVGCGAIKEYEPGTAELKRMFVHPDYRNLGIAGSMVAALEQWAVELGFTNCILETGKKQPEAISLYKKVGYNVTPNYGQYQNVENSVCMKKRLISIAQPQ